MSNLKSTLLASVGAAAMLLAPLAIVPATSLPAGYAAFAAKGGNGGDNGNSDGDHGNSGGDHGNSGDHGGGNSASESRGNGRGSDNGGSKREEKAAAKAAKAEAVGSKEKNLNAQLAGLNSLKRNVNGLMNSSDPRMAGIRDYVEASAQLELAQQAQADAQAAYDDALAAYDDLVTSTDLTAYDDFAYDDTSPEALQARLDELEAVVLDPADPAAAALATEIADLQSILDSTEAATLETASTDLDTANEDVADAEAGTTDADLTAALLEAANKNRVAAAGGDAYVTPEILEWAKSVLGTGDYEGTIDAYLAQQ